MFKSFKVFIFSSVIFTFQFLIISCTNSVVTTNTVSEDTPPKDSHEEIKQCEEVARKILVSSARYQSIAQNLSQQMKDRKSYLGLETEISPFKSNNLENGALSGAYYFTLYEMDQDKQLNIARFIFIYKKAVLYEVDLATNKMKEIEFDTNLLKQYSCTR